MARMVTALFDFNTATTWGHRNCWSDGEPKRLWKWRDMQVVWGDFPLRHTPLTTRVGIVLNDADKEYHP